MDGAICSGYGFDDRLGQASRIALPMTLGSVDATLIKTSEDMARLLLAASPQQAAGFALAAHERACWAQDDDRTGFWLEVIALLADPCTPSVRQSGHLPSGDQR